MTTDQIFGTALVLVLAALGVALIVQLERTHRRTRGPLARTASGDRRTDDADHRRLRDDLLARAAEGTGAPARQPRGPAASARVPRPAGVTSLSRPTATPAACSQGPSRVA